MSQDLNILNQEVNENRLEFGEITRAEQRLGEEEEGEAPAGVAQNVAHLEQEFPEYPTLVYDGPFSEHIEQMTPAFLQGKPQVDEAAARAVAARFLGVAENQVKSVGESDGKIPVYSFSCSRKGGEVSIDVTRQGGSVLQMLDSRTPNAPALDLAAATQKAKAFLREQGYPEMKESYWTSYADTVMINFAPVQDGVILYPDLVKVSIALDDGSVCNFEAQGFLMNHKTRSIPQAKITAKTAESKVAKGLTVLNQNLAVVPSSGRYEVFVRELQCESADGKHCLIYLDAQTGEEVQILILLEDANGILAM